jgi:beta-N-acetylhexosaminidase
MSLAVALALALLQEPRPAPLSLEEKVGQLFVAAGNATFLPEGSPEWARLRRLVVERRVGGIIWYRSGLLEAADLTARLQREAKLPLLVSADLEAGMGMRFDGTTFGPWPMAIAATGDPDLAFRQGKSTAEQARAVGVRHLFAPVADVNVDPDNPVINTRSFGEDPKEVARYVAAFCRGIEAGGGLATPKHFPGHGDTRVDSHRSLPVLRVPRERLEAVELVPFRAAFAAGARSVMVAHLAVPALDPEPAPVRAGSAKGVYEADQAEVERRGTMPATVSRLIVTELLRRELGFDGLAVTDAMDMGGLADHFDAG